MAKSTLRYTYRYLDPQKALSEIKQKYHECELCRLHETRYGSPVMGEGNPAAKIAFVGEAPGSTEEEQGRPFIGRSGTMFRDVLSLLGIQEDQIWVTNAVMCRPPDWDKPSRNRQPADDERKACNPRLMEELYALDPILIIAMGAVGLKALTGNRPSWSQSKGDIIDVKIPSPLSRPLIKPVLVTWHPAGVLRRLTSDDYTDFFPHREEDFIRLATSVNPIHEFIWDILSGVVATMYATTIKDRQDEIPPLVRTIAHLMPFGDDEDNDLP